MEAMEQDHTGDAHRLADMFEEHLTLTEGLPVKPTSFRPELEPVSWTAPSDMKASQSIKYSITQHYTHSSHINTTTSTSTPAQTSPALHPLQPHRDDQTLRQLIQNDIPPASLLRSQLDLFERSNADERARLILLWRLAPPSYARHGGQELADRTGEYQVISMEQEEELAWIRYQRYVGRRDERADARAEQLCGRPSVLGAYYDRDGDDAEASRLKVQQFEPLPQEGEDLSMSVTLEGPLKPSMDIRLAENNRLRLHDHNATWMNADEDMT